MQNNYILFIIRIQGFYIICCQFNQIRKQKHWRFELCQKVDYLRKNVVCMVTFEQIQKDVTDKILDYLVDNEFELPSKSISFEESMEMLLDTNTKAIVPKPRKVQYAKEFLEKLYSPGTADNLRDIILLFVKRFEMGEEIVFSLSRDIFKPYVYDNLLFHWGIYHLHLSDTPANTKADMINNRSDYTLFFLVDNDNVYLIDFRRHPKGNQYADYDFLERIHNNGWDSVVGLKKDDSIVECEYIAKSPSDIKCLWDNKINTIIYSFDGLYYTLLKSVSLSGSNNFLAWLEFKRSIINVLKEDTFESFNITINDDSLISIKLINQNVNTKISIDYNFRVIVEELR